MKLLIFISVLVCAALAHPQNNQRQQPRRQQPQQQQQQQQQRNNNNNNQQQYQDNAPQQQQQQQQHNSEPQFNTRDERTTVIPILSFNKEQGEDGSYKTSYETGNHIISEETGFLKSVGNEGQTAQVQHGSYSYTSPEGILIEVKYTADENGYRAEGTHLPTPPPVPAEIQKSLDLIYAGIKQQAEQQARSSPQSAPQNQQNNDNYNQNSNQNNNQNNDNRGSNQRRFRQ